jgi:hypothetical protein
MILISDKNDVTVFNRCSSLINCFGQANTENSEGAESRLCALKEGVYTSLWNKNIDVFFTGAPGCICKSVYN